MSASSTPTFRPRAARAAARLTVTDDLPTPPLPDAIVTTRVVGPTDVCSVRWLMLKRARSMATVFSSAVISVQSSSTFWTPRSEPTRERMSRCSCARRGQPAVVRAIVTVTVPLSATVARLAMPSSTMSDPSSGSMTPRRAAMTSSGVGRVSTTVGFYRPSPWNLMGGCTVGAVAGSGDAPRLDLLKALGDNTRYAIYLELARSPKALATADIADSLGLHVNTVRPHLERMRDVGLLDVQSDNRGAVGRPQHRYSLAADAPSLGLEPPTFALLARMLLRAAALAGTSAEEAADAGREQGRADGARRTGRPCLDALVGELDGLGFDPAAAGEGATATVAFAHCPFRELAEANPDLVCSLHRGLVEGFVDTVGGGEVVACHTLVDRDPCRVDLVVEPV